ncbi:MAG: ABC transporter ATP-binding protein, partial [bacterium]|nr:ABC transporter ATP-binding protein [bacterium]
SHDLDMIWDCCERTILLSEGKVAADGRTEDILSDEGLLEQNGLELPLSLYKRGGTKHEGN